MPPSEQHSSSHPQSRPSLGEHRSSTSIHSESPSANTPPKHTSKTTKHTKHVAHGGRIHTRVPSGKSLHKLTRAHGHGEGSTTELKKLAKNSASATSLSKSSSHVSLKRNRSSADVTKKEKEKMKDGHKKRPASVHFEIGDQDDAWEEASSSTSPALSRSASRSAQSSAKPSANNSEPQSPAQSPTRRNREPPGRANSTSDKQAETTGTKNTADAKVITKRLLQRIPSHSTTQMTLDNVPRTNNGGGSPPDSSGLGKSHNSTMNSTPKDGSSKDEVVSRFVGGSGTPSDNSPFLQLRKSTASGPPESKADAVKRAKSEGNLAREKNSAKKSQHDDRDDEDEESLLAPRSRKSSTGTGASASAGTAGTTSTNPYNPYLDSRTQQKLWLQRASSNIEPQQLAPGVPINGGLAGMHMVGGGLDGGARDPRVKIQLERTGLEYLVVRRHQDPVGLGLKRLGMLPGAEKNRRIPKQQANGQNRKSEAANAGVGRFGLSQSFGKGKDKDKENQKGNTSAPSVGGETTTTGRSSFEGSLEEGSDGRGNGEDGDVGSLLRSLWEKSCDLSASA